MSKSSAIVPIILAVVISVVLSSLVTWGIVSTSAGVQGAVGPAGPAGPAGADGKDGLDATALPGPQGAQGATGARGAKGADGEDGADGAGGANTETSSIGAGSATLPSSLALVDLFGSSAIVLPAGFYAMSAQVDGIAVTTPSIGQTFGCFASYDGVLNYAAGVIGTSTNQSPYSGAVTWTVHLTSTTTLGYGCKMNYAYETGAATWTSMTVTTVRLDS